ncbi:uncharacterized protein NPIL_441781 [Nephila pilipes]|uniref:Uncharacterized protein n=1 Tax=Nephila pilipes TaxID=299642 RepID=A0A8X6PT06_NEPPI|nr:uncharacterized protein NPIL_441781 [Nephila pilipes]
MPVDPVPRETCVQFVAGSHKWGWFEPIKFETRLPYPIEDKDFKDRAYQHVPDVEANRDKYDILSWELQKATCYTSQHIMKKNKTWHDYRFYRCQF